MFVRKEYPDVLYLVKPSEENEELKYSLRSLKNLNHGRVFIAGYKPTWVDKRIEHIPTVQNEGKYQNVRINWRTALSDSRLSDNFILMNDDFFIMKPIKEVVPLRRLEDIEHYIKLFSTVDPDSYYAQIMRNTRDVLRDLGVTRDHCYDLHTPMVFNKQKLLNLLDKLPNDIPVSTRTVYGNFYGIGGAPVRDVKIINDSQEIAFDQQFLSTIDGSFEHGTVGAYLRKKFGKVLVFSHANDPDGLLSVILAQLAFAEVDYLLTNSPQKDILKYIGTKNLTALYDYVIITDIYPGRPVLEALPQAYWFDHKQHSINKIVEHKLTLPNANIAIEIDGRPTSASELFYRWLKSNQLISDLPDGFVEYIRSIDTWDF